MGLSGEGFDIGPGIGIWTENCNAERDIWDYLERDSASGPETGSGPGIATQNGIIGIIWRGIRHRARNRDLDRELQRRAGTVGIILDLMLFDANS